MQDATGVGQGADSGAVVQHGPDGAVSVVIHCDRCPNFLTYRDAAGMARVRDTLALRWSHVNVSRIVEMPTSKVLTLCGDCTRALRLFMLGSDERATSRVAERWESLVCGAV